MKEMKNIAGSSRFPTELESAFIIISKDPKSTAQDIEQLTTIRSYILSCGPSHHIHDRYFDTPDGRLDKQKLALRVREINNDILLTLKGPSTINGTAVQRMEIEERWSHQAFNNIIKELICRKIEILPLEASMNSLSKPNMFKSMTITEIISVIFKYGLILIQNRETDRTIRNVVADENGPVLAELAIDRVCYHFDAANIEYYEIEIEDKFPDDGTDVIRTVGTALQESYPLFMSQWTSSKLRIGKAIKEIYGELKKGDFLNIIDKNNSLKPSYSLKPKAFERIDKHIREKPEDQMIEPSTNNFICDHRDVK